MVGLTILERFFSFSKHIYRMDQNKITFLKWIETTSFFISAYIATFEFAITLLNICI
jgi:hypothetical protein